MAPELWVIGNAQQEPCAERYTRLTVPDRWYGGALHVR